MEVLFVAVFVRLAADGVGSEGGVADEGFAAVVVDFDDMPTNASK